RGGARGRPRRRRGGVHPARGRGAPHRPGRAGRAVRGLHAHRAAARRRRHGRAARLRRRRGRPARPVPDREPGMSARRLDDIPRTSAPPPGAAPSAVVARLRAIRPSRRAVLRALVIGAAAAALVPLDWYLDRRTAAAVPGSANRAEHTGCAPSSYAEEANNWPFDDGPAVCYGGWRRGSYPCSGGYHREGFYEIDGEEMESTRLATECEGKNAW